ncbi:uncharacterized protein A1O9_03699 [Exophiala aquamarina CBS 119918]|uniref:propanoyl-CoA C-acyltransferase n=1 Tax=Exophiala aquamarina CBS 119918 TaxID=1182545 RepID=A0A072PG84_9EURO|nr:uncharacterized protein A1O9_03699 [Exophiala aquamarina CBS 119918]KEF58856.1 hypothetical protein A1O9_03699 [Exophiala aquamarina CBS 119918]
MATRAFVVGVGMTPFCSPKRAASQATDPGSDYLGLAVEAAVKALIDAGITYDEVDQGVGAYVYGDSTCAQRVFYSLGITGIPIFNVNNWCSSGSTALWLANQAIKSGSANCVLVIGFDKMYPGVLPQTFKDRTSPLSRILDMSQEQIPKAERGKPSPGWTPLLYANAQSEYLVRYSLRGAQKKHFAGIASINRSHGVNNPYSQLVQAVSPDDVLNSRTVSGTITRLQYCPSSVGPIPGSLLAMLIACKTGAGAAVVVSESILASHPHLETSAIEIAGQALATDSPELFESRSAMELIGSGMTRQAATAAYEQAGLGPNDMDVIELHDCFTTNQMCSMEDLGLAAPGEGWKLVEEKRITCGQQDERNDGVKTWIVNPSGGLISKGHPLGATGLAQCAELVWHLRGWTTSRSRPQTKHCLAHNMGLGGATVVTIYKRADGHFAPQPGKQGSVTDGRGRLGYNPAEEARQITGGDWMSVVSQKLAFSAWASKKLPWVVDNEAMSREMRARL